MCGICGVFNSSASLPDHLLAWFGTELECRAPFRAQLAALKPIPAPAPALQLFLCHLAGEDPSDQLFRWLVLSRRCREVVPA